MPEDLPEGSRTATEIQQTEIAKPVAERDTELLKSVAEATADANVLTHNTAQAGKETGAVANNLQAEPVFDSKGNITGYTVRK